MKNSGTEDALHEFRVRFFPRALGVDIMTGQRTATNVPGRKMSVNIDTVFMAELSRLAAAAIFLESSATDKLIRLSC